MIKPGEQISAGTIFTIKQQTSAVYEKGTSKISYADDLKKFEGGALLLMQHFMLKTQPLMLTQLMETLPLKSLEIPLQGLMMEYGVTQLTIAPYL